MTDFPANASLGDGLKRAHHRSFVTDLRATDFVWVFLRPAHRRSYVAGFSLKLLEFGHVFNKPILGAVWPASLQQLSFGDAFNKTIAGVLWAVSLQELSFGTEVSGFTEKGDT